MCPVATLSGLSDGVVGGGIVAAHYDSTTLGELDLQRLVFPEGVTLHVYGATTVDGPMDVALSRGDPAQFDILLFDVSESEPTAFLQADDGSGSFVTLAAVSASSTPIPEGDCNSNGFRDYEDIRSGTSDD